MDGSKLKIMLIVIEKMSVLIIVGMEMIKGIGKMIVSSLVMLKFVSILSILLMFVSMIVLVRN